MRGIIFILIFFAGISKSYSQSDSLQVDSVNNNLVKEIYVQISGVVVTGDKMKPVPFATVMEKSSFRGAIADFQGFFSFVGEPGDTVVFSSVGFKKSSYVIPDTLTTGRYTLIQSMNEDTVYIKAHVVYPWPSREQFRDAFLNSDIPNDDLTRAQNNLNPEILALKQDAYPAGGSLNFKWQMNQKGQQLYYAGQAPPNNLLNPIAWSQFIQAWKNGDFKKK